VITLFGATGYTGRLVARELALRGLPLRLAGRSRAALAQLAAGLPANVALVVADARDPQTLPALAEGTRVLISCAGPFTDLGEPVVALAAREGLRYLDSTNELGFVHGVYTRYDALAQASGATLVPACAFEVALADCAAALLAARLPAGTLDSVAVTYALPGLGSSYGTRASALRSLATSWLSYREGGYVATRPGTEATKVEIDGQPYRALAFPSSEHVTLPAQLRLRRVETWMTVARPAAIYGPWLIPTLGQLLRGPLGGLLRALALRAAPPPDEPTRQAMPFAILVRARAGGEQAALTLRGRDPYGLTARILAYAAEQLREGRPPAGAQPPARAFDPQALLDTLRDEGRIILSD
jgi:short subunit dehydrogenase-like uncharacterized protein